MQPVNAQCVAVVYDVVDDSFPTICHALLIPQFRCQPKSLLESDIGKGVISKMASKMGVTILQ